ncbi:MAG: hypothetical protein ABEI58_02850, partial [Candidatus Nanohaloarchaea archaeon]
YPSVLQTGKKPNVTSFSGAEDTTTLANTPAVEGTVDVDTFRQDIVKGWNAVSFPIEGTTTYNISDIMDTSNIDSIWAYYDGEWHSYDPDAPGSDFTEFKGGYGYLVDANTAFTLAPNVNNVQATSSEASFDVSSGWNLVGAMQEYNQSAGASGAFSDLSSSDIESVQGQSASGSLSFEEIKSGSSSPEDVVPGNAYWLDSSSSNTMTASFHARPSGLVVSVLEWMVGSAKAVISFLGGLVA